MNKDTFSIKTLLLAGSVWLLSACEMTNLDINTDPNRPASAALRLLLPAAELASLGIATNGTGANINNNSATANDIIEIVNNDAMAFSGMGFGNLNADYYNLTNNSYNAIWNDFYRNMQNVEEMLKATEDGANPFYRGIALVLKAFAVGNMVDRFGDIPYSQAWKGNVSGSDKAPKFDKDSEIYEDLLKLCDQAVVELAKKQPVAVSGDFIGGGNATTWTRLAKTVKLRLLFNSRKGRATGNADLVKAFNEGGFISSAAQDFVYQYSTQASPAEDRHPWFTGPYTGTGDAFYINHQLMGEMILNKDPRLNVYFYRQATRILDPANPTDRGTIPFGGTYLPQRPAFLAEYKRVFYEDKQEPTAADLLYLAGYFGRDRSDFSGAPADGPLRAAPGAYPAGGYYSGREIAPKALTGNNPGGNGIWPIITSWNMKFYQVEAILDGTGVAGDAKALFEAAMREQIAFVYKYATIADSRTVQPTAAAVNAYVGEWMKLYDGATTDQAKLNVVAKQIWFCSWGQGMEIWNLMRRTGYPVQGQFRQFSVGIQDPLLKPSRQFALRLPYPSQEGNLNPNAAKYVADVIFDRDPVFWDKTKLKWTF